MNYLLDTCVITDFIKGDQQTLFHLRATSPHDIAVSSVTTMEISYGLALNAEKAKKIQPILDDFFKVIQIIPFEHKDAECAGEIRAFLKQQGTPIGAYDVLLAGTALNRNMILVSSNLREFQRINTLTIENWRV